MVRQKRTLKDIKTSIPTMPESEKVEVLADELDRILAIKRLFNSRDGQELLEELKAGCASSLVKLVQTARTNPDLSLLLALIFDYAAKIDLLSTVQDIGSEKEIRDQLDAAVLEVMGHQ